MNHSGRRWWCAIEKKFRIYQQICETSYHVKLHRKQNKMFGIHFTENIFEINQKNQSSYNQLTEPIKISFSSFLWLCVLHVYVMECCRLCGADSPEQKTKNFNSFSFGAEAFPSLPH